MFSAGIWAFHFGYDNDAKPSMERAAQFINNSGNPTIPYSCIIYYCANNH